MTIRYQRKSGSQPDDFQLTPPNADASHDGRVRAPDKIRLFFAVIPDRAARVRMTALAHAKKSEHNLAGQLIPDSRLHCTLHFVGDYHHEVPSVLIERLVHVAQSVNSPPFDLMFDRVLSFPSRRAKRPFVLLGNAPNDAMHGLEQTLVSALYKAGLAEIDLAIGTPHVTLLYDEHAVASEAVASIAWHVSEFVLVQSFVGQGRHEHLARIALHG